MTKEAFDMQPSFSSYCYMCFVSGYLIQILNATIVLFMLLIYDKISMEIYDHISVLGKDFTCLGELQK